MARTVLILSIVIDPRDREAFLVDIEDILRRFGEEPAPHLQAAFDAEIARAIKVFADCADFRAV